ncbi:hypothetical protein BDZ89DRAFT_1158855 [Hymenopellis radicata]|nr:hypothetical protein BDZ89DRAFT_1158855 [Hymenopellis radicata]
MEPHTVVKMSQIKLVRENEKLKRQLAASQQKAAALQNALQAFVNDKDPIEISSDESDDGEVNGKNGEEEEQEEDDKEDGIHDPHDPIWDDHHGIYRCPRCTWEVLDAYCQSQHCATKLNWTETSRKTVQKMRNTALSHDRALRPRRTTPLNDVPAELLANIPEIYASSPVEYESLLQRGATRHMCERYKLRYTRKRGIVALADENFLADFSTPVVCEGDVWKIHLGRRISLHSEDHDGTEFLTALVEEALIYPMRSEYSNCFAERWETADGQGGPIGAVEYDGDNSSDDLDADAYGPDGPDLDGPDGQPNIVGRRWEHDLKIRAEDRALDPSFGRVYKPPIGYAWERYDPDTDDEAEEGDSDMEVDDPTRRNGSWNCDQSDEEFPSDYSENEMEGCDGDLDDDSESDDGEDYQDKTEGQSLPTDEEAGDVEMQNSEQRILRQEDDIAGIDFDSDECLSGDEDVLHGRC